MSERPTNPNAASFRSSDNGGVATSAEAPKAEAPKLVLDNIMGWQLEPTTVGPVSAQRASQEELRQAQS